MQKKYYLVAQGTDIQTTVPELASANDWVRRNRKEDDEVDTVILEVREVARFIAPIDA